MQRFFRNLHQAESLFLDGFSQIVVSVVGVSRGPVNLGHVRATFMLLEAELSIGLALPNGSGVLSNPMRRDLVRLCLQPPRQQDRDLWLAIFEVAVLQGGGLNSKSA